MKRFILPLLCLPLLLAACTKTTTEDDSPESGKPVIATFVYDVDPLADFSNPTRSNGSVDEDVAEDTAINDINLYVWPTDDPSAVIQKYQDSGRGVSLPLTSGTYHVRIVANVGYDMREMDPEVLDQVGSSYLLSEEEQRRILLFAGKKEITLTETERFFNIELKRLFARTYINVQVADAVQSEITLISAQVCNIPTTAVLFGAPPEGAENFPPAVTCTNNSTVKQAYGNRISDLVYTYENLKPSNPAITTQSQRGGSNVPAGATYVHIITHTPEGFFNYMIYLGENNTSNFTIRRNTSTKYDIVIEGINTVDLRVTTTRLYVCDQGDILCDLQTWPPSKSSAVFYYGMYQVNTSEYDVRENLCFVKCKADQHSLDMDATWVDSDPNELLPLTRDNGYIVEVRGYAARVAHPGYRITSFVDFYYGDPADPTQDVASSRLGVDRKYGYSVDFKLEGISYSDFDLIELRSSGVSVLDVTKKTYTDNGTFSIFAYPNESKVNTPHFNLMFSWPSKYRFLGFFNKDGVKFSPTATPITDADVSWSTNGKGTTTAFWRDANKGSGEVFLRFEKRTETNLDVTTTPLTDGIAHKASPFTITIGNSGNFTGTITFTNGTGTIRKGTTVCTNSVALASGDNQLTITPTSVGNIAFNITVRDNNGLSKTLYYSMNISPLKVSVYHDWFADDTYLKMDLPAPYHSPLITYYKCRLSEAIPEDVDITYMVDCTFGVASEIDNLGYPKIIGSRRQPERTTHFNEGIINASRVEMLRSDQNEACISQLLPLGNYTLHRSGVLISLQKQSVKPFSNSDGTIVFTHYITSEAAYNSRGVTIN